MRGKAVLGTMAEEMFKEAAAYRRARASNPRSHPETPYEHVANMFSAQLSIPKAAVRRIMTEARDSGLVNTRSRRIKFGKVGSAFVGGAFVGGAFVGGKRKYKRRRTAGRAYVGGKRGRWADLLNANSPGAARKSKSRSKRGLKGIGRAFVGGKRKKTRSRVSSRAAMLRRYM